MNDKIIIFIGFITLIVAFVTEIYARKTYWVSKSPRIDLELSGNVLFIIRNVGTGIAINIIETTGLFRDVPDRLWNFSGPVDYIRTSNTGTAKPINFKDEKRLEPSESAITRFEYENDSGDKFYSEIKIERRTPPQQNYFKNPQLMKWGKIKIKLWK